MTLQNTLDIRLTQKLQLTPQLHQAISLLQLSSYELQAYVDEQLLENPFLSKNEDEDYEDDFHHDPYDFGQGRSSSYEDLKPYEGVSHVSFINYLEQQINSTFINAKEHQIALLYLQYLNEDGLLEIDWSEFNKKYELDPDLSDHILKKLQTLEPIGVFARNTEECIEIQLKEKNINMSISIKELFQCLQNLSYSSIHDIAKAASLTLEGFQNLLSHLRHIQFRPASNFSPDMIQTRIPDIFVRKNNTGYYAYLNPHTLPKIILNSGYYNEVKKQIIQPKDIAYIQEKHTQANWLLQSLLKRSTILQSVASEIINRQQHFFESAQAGLKPMTLKEIAEALDIHESTISRVMTAKYIQSPRGLMEMKAFFTSAIKSPNGDNDISSQQVKQALTQIINEEPHEAPFSDDTLSKLLASKGFVVARRTLTKYRMQLDIPSASMRKKHYHSKKLLS